MRRGGSGQRGRARHGQLHLHLAFLTAAGEDRCSGAEMLKAVLHASALYGVAGGILLGATSLLPALMAAVWFLRGPSSTSGSSRSP